MPASDPTIRQLHNSMAALIRWSKEDPVAGTAAARRGLADKFLREVDPEGHLPEDERARRAECARRAFYKRLALESAKARAKRKQTTDATPELRASTEPCEAAVQEPDA
jgi:hypothetical protein